MGVPLKLNTSSQQVFFIESHTFLVLCTAFIDASVQGSLGWLQSLDWSTEMGTI